MDVQKKKISPLLILALQGAVIIYTLSGIFSKMSSNYELMSFKFLLFVFLDLAALGVYALIWQQLIKRTQLSIAYANRATSIFWSMLGAFFIFKEGLTPANIIGVIIVFCGVMLVNSDES